MEDLTLNWLNKLGERALEISRSKGFNMESGEDVPIAKNLMLCVTELSEACESDRIGNYANLSEEDKKDIRKLRDRMYLTSLYGSRSFMVNFEERVKDTFEDELADALLRIVGLAALRGIDLDWHVAMKMHYNYHRPMKHGGKKY